MSNTDTRSVWVVFHWDFSEFAIFDDELRALRYGHDHGMTVINVPFGEDVRKFVNQPENTPF